MLQEGGVEGEGSHPVLLTSFPSLVRRECGRCSDMATFRHQDLDLCYNEAHRIGLIMLLTVEN